MMKLQNLNAKKKISKKKKSEKKKCLEKKEFNQLIATLKNIRNSKEPPRNYDAIADTLNKSLVETIPQKLRIPRTSIGKTNYLFKYWYIIDPMCGEINRDATAVLEDVITDCSNPSVLTIPEIDEHFTLKWNEETICAEQSRSSFPWLSERISATEPQDYNPSLLKDDNNFSSTSIIDELQKEFAEANIELDSDSDTSNSFGVDCDVPTVEGTVETLQRAPFDEELKIGSNIDPYCYASTIDGTVGSLQKTLFKEELELGSNIDPSNFFMADCNIPTTDGTVECLQKALFEDEFALESDSDTCSDIQNEEPDFSEFHLKLQKQFIKTTFPMNMVKGAAAEDEIVSELKNCVTNLNLVSDANLTALKHLKAHSLMNLKAQEIHASLDKIEEEVQHAYIKAINIKKMKESSKQSATENVSQLSEEDKENIRQIVLQHRTLQQELIKSTPEMIGATGFEEQDVKL